MRRPKFIRLILIASCVIMAWIITAPARTDFDTIKKLEEQEKGERQREPKPVLRSAVNYEAKGFRDPFRDYRKEEEAPGSTTKETKPSGKPLAKLEVQGIIWGARFPQAIINGRVVRVGDSVEGAQVIDITKEGVTLFYDNNEYFLSSPGRVPTKALPKKQ